jgi:replicative DNA helicase
MIELNILEADDNFISTDNTPSCYYGIEFLDNATCGIMKADLVLIGARPGAGKTEIANLIAQHNAVNGKNVTCFSLEAEKNEMFYRMLFREVCNLWYMDNRDYVRYTDFYTGSLNIKLKKEIKEARQILRQKYINLNIIYKDEEDYTPEDIEKDIQSRYLSTDLFILDHLHYVDTDDDKENRAMKKLMKTLRNCTLIYKKPIIAIAHLRKKDRGNKDLIPDMDEFHGSSDISKIATKVITLSPYYDDEITESHRNATLMRICKNRIEGSVCKYVAKLIFNAKNNTYEEGYKLGFLSKCTAEFIPLDYQDYPIWYNL